MKKIKNCCALLFAATFLMAAGCSVTFTPAQTTESETEVTTEADLTEIEPDYTEPSEHYVEIGEEFFIGPQETVKLYGADRVYIRTFAINPDDDSSYFIYGYQGNEYFVDFLNSAGNYLSTQIIPFKEKVTIPNISGYKHYYRQENNDHKKNKRKIPYI
mgnify:CR=1 FL=1